MNAGRTQKRQLTVWLGVALSLVLATAGQLTLGLVLADIGLAARRRRTAHHMEGI